MFCTSCGAATIPDARYCQKCGAALGVPQHSEGPGAGAPNNVAAKRGKAELAGTGCLIQLIGLVLLFLFPVGTIVGIALLIYGSGKSIKIVCSACGNTVEKTSTICPHCNARFETAPRGASSTRRGLRDIWAALPPDERRWFPLLALVLAVTAIIVVGVFAGWIK